MLKTLSTEELKILLSLEENANQSIEALALKCNIPKEEISKIKTSLETDGVIVKYKALINWEKIESTEVTAIIEVTVMLEEGYGYDEVAKKIAQFSEVSTLLLVSGSFDLLLEVSGPSLKDVSFFVADKLATIKGVQHTRTNFLLKRYKQAGDLLMVTSKTHRLPMMV